MSAKTVVNGARDFADESQQVVRCVRIEFGPSADSSKGVVYTTTGTKNLIWLPAGTVILAAHCRTVTAFATGQSITIGDSTQADGLFTSAKIAPSTAVTTGILKANSVSDYFNATGFIGGYAIPSARYINAYQTVTGATALGTSSTGKVELFLVYACNSSD